MNTRRLIVQTGDSSRELLFIGRLTVGRATECDISLNDGKVSRRHAELDATGPVPRITDLGSRNGLLVNNRKVTSAELHPGDVIVIGDARIVVEAVDETIAAPGFDGLASSGGGDRTAVIEAPLGAAPEPASPPPVAAPPPPPAPPSVAVPPPVAAAPPPPPPVTTTPVDDDRTAVLSRGQSPSQVVPMLPSANDDDRTAVIPREAVSRPVPPAAPPAPPPSPAAPPVAVPASPPAVPPVQAPAASPATSPVAAPAAPASAESAPAAAVQPAPPALAGPRFSWGGMLMLLCFGLGALATIMAAVPLLSSSTQVIDALSTRQARTLVNWLGEGAARDAAPTTADAIVQTVLSQDNVVEAMVLDASTGQVVAPIRDAGRTITAVPGVGEAWRNLSQMRVVAVGDVVDAVLPLSRGGVPHVAWVRYEKPSTSMQTVALIVALIATMVLAFVATLLIRRHTTAVLGLFTRQVELAVSGADTRVMQGQLVPGLERLPGIVAYLLEQRKAGSAAASAAAPQGVRPAAAPVAEVEEPAWIVVTPSLAVQETSPHAPSAGIRNWASGARGKHLLDVLEPGGLCNAVVQGLGALSNAPGADMTVPVSGSAPVTLRREPGGNVRIALPMR